MASTLTHYPDKPWTQDPVHIKEWDAKGTFICQQKVDGWRVIVIRTETGVDYISRHNKPLTSDIQAEIKQEIDSLDLPVGTQLDAEWIARRSCSVDYKLQPKLYLLDVLRWGKTWLLNTPLIERVKKIDALFLTTQFQYLAHVDEAKPGEFWTFWLAQQSIPYSEGVVIKHKLSKIVGNRKECKKNDLWMKIKYRGSSSGDTLLARYQQMPKDDD